MKDYLQRNHQALLEFMFLTKDKFDNFAIPLKQNHQFDVIAISLTEPFSKKCQRIKIICTENKQKSGSYVANLLKSGGYEDRKEKKIYFDPTSCNALFIWTPEQKYLIPCGLIVQKRAITLSAFEDCIISG